MKHSTRNPQNNLFKTLCSVLLVLVMIPGVLAQEVAPGEDSNPISQKEINKAIGSPDKSATYTLNVANSDALIYGLTVGRGGGNISTNSAFGINALLFNTTGPRNTAIGSDALKENGLNATEHYHATANTALGSLALFANTTGFGNTAVGSEALISSTIGSWNTAFGLGALYQLTEGSENVAIGDFAGTTKTNISQGTFIGSISYPITNNLSNVTGIGYNVRPDASNQVRIGNVSVTSIGGQVSWTALGDGAYKNNIEEDVAGLDFILKLRPVSYNLDVHKLASDREEDLIRAEDGSKATSVPDEITQKSRDEKAAIRYTGFVAQEVEATVNELGVAFSGVDAPVNKSGHYGLRYSDFVVPLVKAVQEQQAQIEALSPEGIDALRAELSELRLANEQLFAAEVSLRAENQHMRGQINDIISQLENLGVDLMQSTGYGINDSQQQYPSVNARLEQNTPNPFHENTVIRYFLPEGTNRAQIIITDLNGTQVMAFPLEHHGAGQLLIHGRTMPSGNYVYTLVVDGRQVESKRMVLL